MAFKPGGVSQAKPQALYTLGSHVKDFYRYLEEPLAEKDINID